MTDFERWADQVHNRREAREERRSHDREILDAARELSRQLCGRDPDAGDEVVLHRLPRPAFQAWQRLAQALEARDAPLPEVEPVADGDFEDLQDERDD